MELKPKIKRCAVRFYPTFNRTSMELKPFFQSPTKSESVILLIEPVWNWNNTNRTTYSAIVSSFNRTSMELKPAFVRCAPLPVERSFNRTSMELKQRNDRVVTVKLFLLIEPVWNWNFTDEDRETLQLLLLIEPVWNWNTRSPVTMVGTSGLLIEPVWNWNLYNTTNKYKLQINF